MRSLLFVLSVLAVIGSGYWAYRENYRTQDVLDEVQTTRQEIGAARERLSILRAEWAYLNRPDRLRDLAELNFDKLGLMPLRPDQFGSVDQVAYPVPEVVLDEADEIETIAATDP